MAKKGIRQRTKEQMAALKDAIFARFESCKSVAKLAIELNVDEAYMRRLANKLGLLRPKGRKRDCTPKHSTASYKPVNEAEPTQLRPGVEGKVELLAQRVLGNRPLFPDGDYQPPLD